MGFEEKLRGKGLKGMLRNEDGGKMVGVRKGRLEGMG